MQFINNQYKVKSIVTEDNYGSTFVVEDIFKGNAPKYLRIINLQKDTQEFIAYMKENYYDYSNFDHPNSMEFNFFNKLKLVDGKFATSSKYYYTYSYFEGTSLFDFVKDQGEDVLYDIIIQLLSAVKHMHLRGFLLCNVNNNELIVAKNGDKPLLKIVGLSFPQNVGSGVAIDKNNSYLMAPQVLQYSKFTKASDIYLLGALLFYVFSQVKMEDTNFAEVLNSFSYKSDSVFAKLRNIIIKCTAVNIGDRYESVDDIAKAVNEAFNKSSSIIKKEYIERMPIYRIKPVGRYEYINSIVSNINDHFYGIKPDKFSLVASPAGVGRISFMKSLEIRTEQEGLSVFNTALSKNAAGERFSLVSWIIKAIVEYIDKDLLDKYTSDIRYIVPDLFNDNAPSTNDGLMNNENKLRLIYRLGNLIIEASRKLYLVFLIDNFENVDEESLELIEYLLQNQGRSFVYFVFGSGNYNAEENDNVFTSKLKQFEKAKCIVLQSYNLNETAEYIRLMLGMDKIDLSFTADIYKETDGSPDYIFELICALFSNNSIYVDDEGKWVLSHIDFDKLDFNASMDQLIWNKINKLNKKDRKILEIISVFNSAVSHDILENLIDIKHEELFEILNYLSYINILSKTVDEFGVTYEFGLANLKKSMYDRLSQEEKFKYHFEISYALERKKVRESREGLNEIIYHMMEAKRDKEAVSYLITAAEKMIAENQVHEAIKSLKQAIALFQQEDSSINKTVVFFKVGKLYEQIDNYTGALDIYNVIEDIVHKKNDNKMLINVYIKKFSLLYKLDRTKQAINYAVKAKKLIKETNYIQGLYELIIQLNIIMVRRRKYSSYIRIIDKLLLNFDKNRYEVFYAKLMRIYGVIIIYKRRYEEGLGLLLENCQQLEKFEEFMDLCGTLNAIGYIYSEVRFEVSKAREYYERCLVISQKINSSRYIESSYNNLAEIYRLEDKYKEALTYYHNALEIMSISQEKYIRTLLNGNISLTNIALEEYKQAEQDIKIAGQIFDDWKDSGDIEQFLSCCKSELYYRLGYFKLARDYAQKSIDMCMTWGIAANQEACFNKLLADIMLGEAMNFDREMMFCNEVLEGNFFKLGRVACYNFAELYVENGENDKAEQFIELGQKYSEKIETDILKLQYQYIAACIAPSEERLEKLLNLVGGMEAVESNEIKWKIYKSIALALFENKSYPEALKYLITALNHLRKLVHNVPDEHKVTFILSHGRNTIKEKLVEISEIVTGKKDDIESSTGKWSNSDELKISLKSIDKYFDYSEFRSLYSYHGADLQETNNQGDLSAYGKFLLKLHELLNKFTEDNAANIKELINVISETAQAKNTFIATLGEDDELNILSSYSRFTEIPFYKYIIEQVKQTRDSIIVTDGFEYNRKKGNILIPKDITAVFCIPIMAAKEEEIGEIGEKRRRNKAEEDSKIIGYIYMDTDSIINNFTEESSKFCIEAAKIAYILVDNYNLKIVSTIDKLTKLYTRKYFEGALQKEMAYAESKSETGGGEFSIIMLDIDKFKTVNDRFGHQRGDEVLQNVSNLIMNTVRKGDICGRYGGEEIIILLPSADAKSGMQIAEKIRKRIDNAKLLGLQTPLTVSLGVASYPEHSMWAKDLIEKADQALYHAKETGRNRSVVYEPDLSKSVKRIDKLAGIISGNLVDDQRKVETMLEILELQRNMDKNLKEKMFDFLGRIIEVSEAQTGIIFYIEEGKIKEKLMRKKFIDTEITDAYYNENLVEKCIKEQRGEYQVDWSGYQGTDTGTGIPDWQSNILLPIQNQGELKGVLYLASSAKHKEFDAASFNFIKTLCDIVSPVFEDTSI